MAVFKTTQSILSYWARTVIQETKIGALRPPDLSPLRKQNVRLKF